jgi:hypothetical protein
VIATPLLITVGADKGGVGKTTIARAVIDYAMQRGANPKTVDTEAPQGNLRRFYPDATVVDITEVQQQMSVFDDVEIAKITVLDIRAGLLSSTLKALDTVQLFDDVRAGRVNLAILHVLGPTLASFSEIQDAAQMIGGGARHFLVKNHVSAGSTYFEWDKSGDHGFDRFRDITVTVPHLDDRAVEDIELQARTFWAFAHEGTSRTLRGYVTRWLNEIFAEFDRVGLDKLIAAALAS